MKRFILNLMSVSFTLLVAMNAQAAGKSGGGSQAGPGRNSVSSSGNGMGNTFSRSSNHSMASNKSMSHGSMNHGLQGPKTGSQQLRSMMRTSHHASNYHVNFGTKRSFGYSYFGNHHNHWSYCYFDSRYNCNLYWCPSTFAYYYWCPTDTTYFPVSYVPYGNYCGCSTVIDTSCPVVPYQTVFQGPR